MAAPSWRRAADARRSLPSRIGDLFVRFARWQDRFSVASSALAAVLALTLIVDLIVGHPHIQRGAVMGWILSYVAFTVLPLACGRRYPRWFGLVFVAYLTFWSTYSLLHSNHAHMELNSLLEAPMVAVYLGWFFRPGLARAGLLLHLAALTVAVLVGPPSEDHRFSSSLALLYAVLISGFCLEAASFIRRRAEREAWHDPLTRVLNRRGLTEYAREAIARAKHTGEPLMLAVVDFDDFKAVNDRGGHAAGDDALRTCSAEWVEGLGEDDLVARTGGDEFVLVMHADEAAANARLAALQAAASHSWSWGITHYSEGDTLDSLMLRADEALYRQKDARGR